MRSRPVLRAVALVTAGIAWLLPGVRSGAAAASQRPLAATPADVSPAGDISDTQAFVRYSPPTGGYSITVPEGWARSETANAAVFSDRVNIVRIERVNAPGAPTTRSVATADIPRLRAEGARKISRATIVRRKAGSAVRLRYLVTSAPDPTTGKTTPQAVERYQFWRHGTAVAITLSGAQGADNVDPWRTITDSFAWAT
jgi:hypothetical protein